MVNQHAKWLKTSSELAWRKPISLAQLPASPRMSGARTTTVLATRTRALPTLSPTRKPTRFCSTFLPDANTLLWVTDHCLRTYNRINVITAGKQPAPQWLTAEEAEVHCRAGAGIWQWALETTGDNEPDVVMACAGDVPTLETLLRPLISYAHHCLI